MYNFKDKAVHVADLQRERFADVDLLILQEVNPDHPESRGLRPASQRHEVILHALLDVITREEVERRRASLLNSPEGKEVQGGEKTVESTDGGEEPDPGSADGRVDEIVERVEGLEEQISDLSEELTAEKKSGEKSPKSKKKKSIR